jgi:hypothetical protein
MKIYRPLWSEGPFWLPSSFSNRLVGMPMSLTLCSHVTFITVGRHQRGV